MSELGVRPNAEIEAALEEGDAWLSQCSSFDPASLDHPSLPDLPGMLVDDALQLDDEPAFVVRPPMPFEVLW